MRVLFWLGVCLLLTLAHGEESKKSMRPGIIQLQDLREAPSLAGKRRNLIEAALALATHEKWYPYTYSGESPEEGGFDCSGAMFYLIQKVGIDPPRSSQAQYDWLKQQGVLVEVPSRATSIEDITFSKLRPGDLLFWSGTTSTSTGAFITHVQMFLGHERANDLPVMAGASDGRTYHGTKRSGYGVYDFKLPAEGSKARLVAFGTPPGIQ